MIHPQDLADFNDMTGSALIPKGFEEEYVKWLRMHHRRKGSGPLGALMIPLCRMFKLGPPAEAEVVKATNWRTVDRGQRVRVQVSEGESRLGKFNGLGPYGEVNVILDGETWVQGVKPMQVEIVDNNIPVDLKLTAPERAALSEDLSIPPAEVIEREEVVTDLPSFDPAMDLDDDEAPQMTNAEWYEVAEGTRVVVEHDGDLPDAKFVKLGPNDGEITVVLEGSEELMTFPETAAAIA